MYYNGHLMKALKIHASLLCSTSSSTYSTAHISPTRSESDICGACQVAENQGRLTATRATDLMIGWELVTPRMFLFPMYTVDSILSRDWIMQKQLALIFRHTVPKRAAAVECQSLRYANVLRCPNMQSESYGPKPWIDGAAPSSVR